MKLKEILCLLRDDDVICVIGQEEEMHSVDQLKLLSDEYSVDSIGSKDGKVILGLQELRKMESAGERPDWIKEHVARYGTEPNMFDGA